MRIFYCEEFLFSPAYIKADGSISSFAFTLKKGEDGISTDLERLADYEYIHSG